METVFIVLHVIIAVSLIVIVLLQQGKGAEAGSAFGGGNSSSLFGSLGAMPFLTKLTVALVAMFFVTSLSLAVLASKSTSRGFSITVPAEEKAEQPAQPETEVIDLSKDGKETVEEKTGDVPTAPPVETNTPK